MRGRRAVGDCSKSLFTIFGPDLPQSSRQIYAASPLERYFWGMKPRKPYPSDISPEQFEQIRPLLESVRKRTKPRTVDLHEVFNAVLYLLKSGCQWRMLPEGFPNWVTVYSYFAKWSATDRDGVSALERALKKIRWRGPRETGAQRHDQLHHC